MSPSRVGLKTAPFNSGLIVAGPKPTAPLMSVCMYYHTYMSGYVNLLRRNGVYVIL